MEKHKNCPWCKEETNVEPISLSSDDEYWTIQCQKCLCTGPIVIACIEDFMDGEEGCWNAAFEAWDRL